MKVSAAVTLVGVIMLLLMYIVPYTLLVNSKGLELYLFWTFISIFYTLVALLGLKRLLGASGEW